MKQLIYIFLAAFLFISCEANENEEVTNENGENNTSQNETATVGNSENNAESNEIASNDNNDKVEATSGKKEFEGLIKFDIVIEPKTPTFNPNKVKNIFGESMNMYFSKGRYKIDYSNAKMDKIIYNNKENKQYIFNSDTDTLYVIDCSNVNSNLYSKLHEDVDYEVLDRDVKYVGLFTNQSKQHSYYDPDIYINPEHFKNHKYGHVDEYYKMAESPYIYSEIEYNDFKVIMQPTKIVETELKDSEFEIPDNRPMEEKNLSRQ